MENTKDMIFNVKYAGEVEYLYPKKNNLKGKYKFIRFVVGITLALVSVDVVMLMYFIGMIGKM